MIGPETVQRGLLACHNPFRRLMMWTLLLGLFSGTKADAWQNIGGLGRIIPRGDIVQLTGPTGEIIDSIYVKQGDTVRAGALLVSFRSRAVRRFELDLAQLALRETRQVNDSVLAMKRLEVSRQEHNVELAQIRLQRVEEAGGNSFSPRQMEQYTDELFMARNLLEVARADLEKTQVEQQSGIQRATLRVGLAREQLNLAALTAPTRGTILEVNARLGETAAGPIIRMADLTRMYVVCDIFEADLRKLTEGMKATIRSNSLPAPLEGTVESVGMIIDNRSQMGKVTIRLRNGASVARLINLQVDVSIQATP